MEKNILINNNKYQLYVKLVVDFDNFDFIVTATGNPSIAFDNIKITINEAEDCLGIYCNIETLEQIIIQVIENYGEKISKRSYRKEDTILRHFKSECSHYLAKHPQ